ncbi:MAG: autotransporter domain-containing protein [Rhodobacteraceae bacterium]|nr:autotransporter domain-containing protein [Paracoccaceae bacterium]
MHCNDNRFPAALRRGGALCGVALLATALTPPLHAADVEIAADVASGVALDTLPGSTARVQPGVTVTNSAFATPISASTSAWALTNAGTILADQANAVSLSFAGSAVTNAATITGGGISLSGGGTVDNQTGATISAPLSAIAIGSFSAGAGTVTNSGTITQTGLYSDLVVLLFGGAVTNTQGATISANNGGNAVSVGQGASRAVINAGTITNTGTGYATGVLLQGGPSTLTNTATGTISGTFNGVYTSASGVLTFTNDGLIQSTGASSSARAVEATGGGTFVNTGTITSASSDGLYLARAGTVTNSGTITGAVNAISFAGNYARTLTLDTGSVLNGLVQGGSGTDDLVLQGTGSEDGGKFRAFETLTMQGAAWTLTGTGSFATGATVQAGTLTLAGSLATPLTTVNAGGVLTVDGSVGGATLAATGGRVQGTGTLGAVTVAAGGTLAPGDAAGAMATLATTGTVTFDSGALYEVDVDASGAADLVSGTGGATLTGGTVDVRAVAGSYAPATQYTILTDTGGVSGSFATATSNLAFLSPVLSYTPTDAILTLNRNGLDFSSVGGSFNQRSTGAGVEPLGGGNPVFDAVVVLDAPTARMAFDQLSGEVFPSIRTAFLDDSRFAREAALDRLRRTGTPPARRFTVWGQGYGAQGHWPGDGNAASLHRDLGGLFLGVDGMLDGGWQVGVLGGFSHTSLAVDARNASASSNDYSLGLYAGRNWGPLAFRAGVGTAWHDVRTLRTPAFSGYADRLGASYGARTAQAYVELGYDLGRKTTVIEPFVNLAYVNLSTAGFTETGGAAAITAASQHQSVLFSTLGLRASKLVTLDSGQTVRLHGMLGWRAASGHLTPTSDVALAGGAGFVVAGVPIVRNLGVVDLGVSVQLSANSDLDLTYSGQFGSGVRQNVFGIVFKARF